jgi:hypothetical protein
MADEIVTLDGAASDSEVGAQSETVSGSTVDWTSDPKYREFQSRYDRQQHELAQQQRRIAEAEQRARLAEQQRDGIIQSVREVDPESADTIALQAENMRLRAIADQQAQREAANAAWQQFRDHHTDLARAAGIDPNDSRFQNALNSGDHRAVERAKADIIREQAGATMKATDPAREERAQRTREAEESGAHVILPTGGGSGPAPDATLMAAYRDELKRVQGNIAEIIRVKNKYRDKGLVI